MKTLEQIKNDYAVKHGYYDWQELIYSGHCTIINIVIDELLILVQKECLKNAFNSEVNSGVCETVANRITDDQNIIL